MEQRVTELQIEMAVERCNLKGDSLRTRLENQVDKQVIDDIRNRISKVLAVDQPRTPMATSIDAEETLESFTSAPRSF